MKLIAILLLLSSFSTMATEEVSEAAALDCRDAIVEAYAVFGHKVDREAFASMTFEDFAITVEQFNALPAKDQASIYNLIKPLDVVVEQTIGILNSEISQISGSVYEFFYIDELQAMRGARDLLRSCVNNG